MVKMKLLSTNIKTNGVQVSASSQTTKDSLEIVSPAAKAKTTGTKTFIGNVENFEWLGASVSLCENRGSLLSACFALPLPSCVFYFFFFF